MYFERRYRGISFVPVPLATVEGRLREWRRLGRDELCRRILALEG